MKKIKHYLHLYLGCEVFVFPAETATNGWYAEKKQGFQDGWGCVVLTIDNFKDYLKAGYLPILRPLSDIAEDEQKDCLLMTVGLEEYYRYNWDDFGGSLAPEQFHYLLSKHFDLFGLIESGLAIDKTTLTPKL